MKTRNRLLAVFAAAILAVAPMSASATTGDVGSASSQNRLEVYGVTLDWDPETFWAPSGCSSFAFKYSNGSGIRLLVIEFELLSVYGDKVAWESEIGVDPGIYGTWSEQICASDLADGLGPYKLRLTIEDYAGSSRSAEGELTFKARPAVVKNVRIAPTANSARVTWGYLPNATGYELRFTYNNNSKKFGPWNEVAALTSPNIRLTKLASKTNYRVQIRAVTDYGYGPVVTVSFRTR
jgi:hypothetical protein